MTVKVINSTADRTEDTVAGASSYILARSGNQTLVGNDGGDTYVFDWARMFRDPATVTRAVMENGADAGVDTILINGRSSAHAKIIFEGSKYFLLLLNVNNQLSSNDRRIELVGFDPAATGNAGIERIQFLNNGVLETWDRAAMLASLQTGTGSGDSLIGTSGDDVRNGGAGNDSIFGGAGSDILTGGTGNDSLDGGADGDTYVYAAGVDGTDTISDTGATGVDVLNMIGVSASNARISFNATGQLVLQTRTTATGTWSDAVVLANTVLGNSAAGIEEIRFGSTVWTRAEMKAFAFDRTGDNRAARIIGTEAADTIIGGSAADTVMGGAGNDTLFGGSGADSLSGDADADSIVGGADNDRLFGGAGSDTIAGDVVLGGAGDDSLVGETSSGRVFLRGGTGNDTLVGAENETFYYFTAGDGSDEIRDAGGFDGLVLENVSADTVRLVQDGADILVRILNVGGTVSTIRIKDALLSFLEGGDRGIEQIDIIAPDGSLVRWNRADILSRLMTGADGDGFMGGTAAGEEIRGASDEADTGRDRIWGGGGNDTLLGGGGDDTLFGGSGGDHVFGGDGADSLFGDFVLGGAGDDTIVAEADSAVSDLVGGTGDDSIVGNINSSFFYYRAGDGNDVITDLGGFGQLVLIGIAPSSVRVILSGKDLLVRITNADGSVSTVTLKDAAGLALAETAGTGVGVESIRFTAEGQADVTWWAPQIRAEIYRGGDGDTTLVGSAAGESISGAESVADTGRDSLSGAGGDDFLFGGAGDDTLVGGDGYDLVYGGVGNDLLFGEVVVADDGDDTVFGEDWGAVGHIRGGKGTDSLFGGTGNTFFYYQAGDGNDTIQDLIGLDTLVLENVDPASVSLRQVGNDVVVSVTGADGSVSTILLKDAAQAARVGGDGPGIEVIEFRGTFNAVWNAAEIRSRIFVADAGDTTMSGSSFNDELRGAASDADAGRDSLSGLEGDDQIFGGAGNYMPSGGQRQRIGLARALYGDPFLLVLDEPNSNLDNEGEEALTAALSDVRARGGIVVVVAHRPSALGAVDMVAMMSEGQIRHFGPRDEVLAKVLQPQRARNVEILRQGGTS